MTDANGSKRNLNGRRLRRSGSAAGSNVAGSGAASRLNGRSIARPGENTSKAGDKAIPADRRTRRRRQSGRAGERLIGQTGGMVGGRPSRLSGLSSTPKSLPKPDGQNEAGSTGRQNAAKAAPRTHLSSFAAKGSRRERVKEPASRASGGSVPLSSSLVRRRRRPKLPNYVASGIGLLVGSLGLATVFGTVLANRPGGETNTVRTESVLATGNSGEGKKFPIALTQEIPTLKAELEKIPELYPGLQFKAFYVDVDTGDYVDMDGREAIAAASTIKLPILLAFFEEVDKGNIDPNQTVAILPEQVAEGSGEMQMSPPGTQFTALEVATQMIVHSDNTATNMMIALLGGAEVLNERFAGYGLEETRLNNPLPDIEGTNTTSARDLVQSMVLVQGDTLQPRSRDHVLNILKRTENKRLLAAGLEEQGALTYNKTGFIGKMLGDVLLVDLSNGKRYAVSVLVERPDNDGRAVELIHSISQRTYQYTDKAVQRAVTPLGNPDGSSPEGSADSSVEDSAAPADSEAVLEEVDADSITITPVDGESGELAPPVDSSEGESEAEEAPYPSANP